MLGEGEKKELVQTYMSQRLTRDKALSICKISKNQFYYKATTSKRGRRKSKHTDQLIKGIRVKQSNNFVVKFIKEVFEDPKIDYGYRKMTGHLGYQSKVGQGWKTRA